MSSIDRFEYIRKAFRLIKEPFAWQGKARGEGFMLMLMPQNVIRNEIYVLLDRMKIPKKEEKLGIYNGKGLIVMLYPVFFESDQELEKVCNAIREYIFKKLPHCTKTEQQLEMEIKFEEEAKIKEEQLREKIMNDPELQEIYHLGMSDCKKKWHFTG